MSLVRPFWFEAWLKRFCAIYFVALAFTLPRLARGAFLFDASLWQRMPSFVAMARLAGESCHV
eukprot:15458627-Alexandrium_andersonii.AAC.1